MLVEYRKATGYWRRAWRGVMARSTADKLYLDAQEALSRKALR